MKTIVNVAVLVVVTLLSATAMAEMQFPEYEQQPKEAQASWGYAITRTTGRNPGFSVTIPPKAATKCAGARLYIRSDKNHLLAQFDIAPIKQKDDSIIFTVELFEELEGNAELILYTDYIEGATMTRDFGGFTFKVKVEKP